MNYHRMFVQGGTYFFTVVTNHRQKILRTSTNTALLQEAFAYVMKHHPFTMNAFVILPEHIHCIWTLPLDDSDFATRWRLIKSFFTHNYLKKHIPIRKQGGIWQKRYWEHLIRDEQDLQRHFDYIHYNPVKHALTLSPFEWQHSSFNEYVAQGFYPHDWGASGPLEIPEYIGNE